MNIIARVLHKIARWFEGAHPRLLVKREFLDWIGYAIPGMTDPGNYYGFDYAIRRLPSASPILEIGSWCGRSAVALAYFLELHGRPNRLVTCDKWDYERDPANPHVGDSRLTHVELRRFLKDSFMRNVSLFCPNRIPETVEWDSDGLFAAWADGQEVVDVFGRNSKLGGPISFCFIDGNHTYAYAKRDFDNCDRFLEPGGFVLFDDSADGSGWEVCRLVKEVEASGRYMLEMKNPNYLFRKKPSEPAVK